MQPSALVGEILGALAARLHVGAGTSSPVWDAGAGDTDGWIATLASLLVLFAVGGVAARVAGRLMRRTTPELTVLLNQSAAFYRRWPGDRHAGAPSAELAVEVARCRRIVQLLEARAAAEGDTGPAVRGPIDGLQAWITLLARQIQGRTDTTTGVYA